MILSIPKRVIFAEKVERLFQPRSLGWIRIHIVLDIARSSDLRDFRGGGYAGE